MKRRMVALMLVLVMAMSLVGCRRIPGPEPTKKTPNQILWQLRCHIKQVTKDVKDAREKDWISEGHYQDLRKRVVSAADNYNKLKAHYALLKELDDTYRHKITVALLYISNVVTPLKGGE